MDAQPMPSTPESAAPVPPATPVAGAPVTYKDEDLVYVDPDNRTVVGFVEWSNSGRPKAMPMKKDEVVEGEDAKGKPTRKRRERYYPWGTYRSMKRIYKLEGKVRDEKPPITLDQAIEKSMAEPFWN